MSTRRIELLRGTRPRRGGMVFIVLGTLAALDVGVLVLEHTHERGPRALNAPTGALVHSNALAPAWTFRGVDRRGNAACEAELSPLVGAPCCDPGHRHEPEAEGSRLR